MRLTIEIGTCVAILALVAPAAAQTPYQTIASSAEVKAVIAKCKAEMKPGGTFTVEPVNSLASQGAYIEYRTGRSPTGNTHLDDEIVYIIDGAGVFSLGGHLATLASDPAAGTQVIDGTSRPVTKGDMLLIPHNTPHQVISTNGRLVLLSLKAPLLFAWS